MPNNYYKSALAPGTSLYPQLDIASIPSITKWIETVLTTAAVRPELRDNLHEELEQ
jgi:hypothetical protein